MVVVVEFKMQEQELWPSEQNNELLFRSAVTPISGPNEAETRNRKKARTMVLLCSSILAIGGASWLLNLPFFFQKDFWMALEVQHHNEYCEYVITKSKKLPRDTKYL